LPERVTIRPGTERDFAKVVECYDKKGETPWDPFSSVDRLATIPLEGLLIAEAAGRYAGFLYWFVDSHPWFDPSVERCAHVVEIQVLREFAGWLTGPLLVQAAFKEIESRGFPTVYFDTVENSAAAQLLGDRLGYVGHMRIVRLRFDYTPEKNWDHRNPEDLRMLLVFLVELYEQARICRTAFAELCQIIEALGPMNEEKRRTTAAQIWTRVQAIVVASSVISRILWPAPAPRADGSDRRAILRGMKLRTFLQVDGQEPPSSKAVRNAFEHIDERLDVWHPRYSAEGLPPGWVLSHLNPEDEGSEAKEGFRYYNLFSTELRIAGKSCNLREVVERVRRIQDALPPQAQISFSPAPVGPTRESVNSPIRNGTNDIDDPPG
jgi:GNAT superfamily N-acetyltransferase